MLILIVYLAQFIYIQNVFISTCSQYGNLLRHFTALNAYMFLMFLSIQNLALYIYSTCELKLDRFQELSSHVWSDYCTAQCRFKVKTLAASYWHREIGMCLWPSPWGEGSAWLEEWSMHKTRVLSACPLCHCKTCVVWSSPQFILINFSRIVFYFFLKWFIDVVPGLLLWQLLVLWILPVDSYRLL